MAMRSLAILAIVVLAGCDQIKPGYSDDDLIGGWSCSVDTEGGTISGDVEYAKGGRSSAFYEIAMEEDGVAIEIVGSAAATWELDGDKLTEEVTKFSIIAMTVGFIPITDGALLRNSENAMVNQVTTSTIKSLDGKTLLLTSSEGETSCQRRG
jgi:hypothetical protein